MPLRQSARDPDAIDLSEQPARASAPSCSQICASAASSLWVAAVPVLLATRARCSEWARRGSSPVNAMPASKNCFQMLEIILSCREAARIGRRAIRCARRKYSREHFSDTPARCLGADTLCVALSAWHAS